MIKPRILASCYSIVFASFLAVFILFHFLKITAAELYSIYLAGLYTSVNFTLAVVSVGKSYKKQPKN